MISILRLIDGTEVIGHISFEDSNHIVLKDPMQIIQKYRSDLSVPVVSMHRFIPFAKEHIHSFKSDHVIAKTAPMGGLSRYYTALVKTLEQDKVDKSLDDEFNNAAQEELTEEMKVKIAMMEKLSTKATLN